MVPEKLDASGKCKWRICLKLRRLSDITLGDNFPLPNIQDIMDKLGRAKYFCAQNYERGYWQVPLAEDVRAKTTFSTPTGHYE